MASCSESARLAQKPPELTPAAKTSPTVSASSTFTPMAMSPTKTAPRPLPTWTPLSTLSPGQALLRVQTLVDGSPDCLLPCWWGLNVGVTPWREAAQALGPIATSIELWRTITSLEPDGPHAIADYNVRYQLLGGSGGMAVTTRDEIVYAIFVNTESTSRGMAAYDIFRTYGAPSLALIRTYEDVTPFGFPFLLLLFYQDQRFMVIYDFEAFRSGADVVGCPANSPPKLFIWSPEEPWTMDKIQTRALGVDYYRPLSGISEATTYTVHTLYKAFLEQGVKLCIRTPATAWQ
jgi:hypothetical protein